MTPPLRARILVALVAVAVIPVGALGITLVAIGIVDPTSALGRFLILGVVLAALGGVFASYLIVDQIARPLREIARTVERVAAGDLGARIALEGDDELARLAESHDRLAADLERRDRELGEIRDAVGSFSPADGIEPLVARATSAAVGAFGLIDARIVLGAPGEAPEPLVPGEPREVRAELRSGGDHLGLLVGRAPATRRWEAGDQDLLDLLASETATALRTAELVARVEAQNVRLLELDAAKDDFLRGIGHNLQTPLARIRAYADQLASDAVAAGEAAAPGAAAGMTTADATTGSAPGTGESPDRRAAIISEQADRLSRMVRQLLTVSRLDSGVLRPTAEVVGLTPRVRRAWEALGQGETAFELADHSAGWLAVADPDQLDQVLWALLDNAVKHGGGGAIHVAISADPAAGTIRLTVADDGPGVPRAERERLFERFARGSTVGADGSGLGLYVSRRLCRAMGGELLLEPEVGRRGAAFTVVLQAEPATE